MLKRISEIFYINDFLKRIILLFLNLLLPGYSFVSILIITKSLLDVYVIYDAFGEINYNNPFELIFIEILFFGVTSLIVGNIFSLQEKTSSPSLISKTSCLLSILSNLLFYQTLDTKYTMFKGVYTEYTISGCLIIICFTIIGWLISKKYQLIEFSISNSLLIAFILVISQTLVLLSKVQS